MKITFIFVGNIKEKYLEDAFNEYLNRIKNYAKLEVIRIKEVNSNNINDIIRMETKLIIDKINHNSYKILLDLKGKELDSIELSKKIDNIFTYHNSHLTFIIGGSNGVDNSLKELCNEMLCFSKLTFPHQLIQIFLLEQIYRSFKIINNEQYHK